MNTIAQSPPLRTIGRFAASMLHLTIMTGITAQTISSRLVSPASILAGEQLYTLGFTIYMVEMACQIAYSVLFYQLLRDVSRPVAQIALALGLVGCTVKLMSRLFYSRRS